MQEKWWRSTLADVVLGLSSDARHGLSSEEAEKRFRDHGPNELQEKKGRGPLLIFLDQFKGLIIWVLIGAALVSGFLKEWVDALAILAIIIMNAVMGLIQEYRAEKSLAALKKMAAPSTKVYRNGIMVSIPARELVPGDLVELESGDNVPADARVVHNTSNFSVQEASLTGESAPVAKTKEAIDSGKLGIGDRKNILHMGTSVVSGKARAVVFDTGMGTELGRIAGMIQDIKKESTPLQNKLEDFSKLLIIGCFILVGLVFGMELLRGGKLFDMFLTAVSLAVAAIPEGLPAVVTIALALGVQRMVKRHVLIRKLASVESLGCATVICSDKTGTLTQNEMTVQRVWTPGGFLSVTGIGYEPKGDFQAGDKTVDPKSYPDLLKVLTIGALCNNAHLGTDADNKLIATGDPTEIALLTSAAKAGICKQDEEGTFVMVEEIPFDSDRKMMSIVRQADDDYYAFTKGAPDLLLGKCTHILDAGRERPITDDDKLRALQANDELSNQALRVLGMAFRTFDDKPDMTAGSIETGLTFVGLQAMIDPPRPEARVAVAACRKSGIKTVMITGDHKNTAMAIGRQIGFLDGGAQALSGEELDRLSDEELDAAVENTTVYARVSPEHKLRIVRSFKRKHEVTAMTGDGVNDAPAIKEADIGVAMGITGTDVTKEVSDMVITDDNFASIVAAVEEGRGIFDNIRKFIHYLLSCNAGEILVMFLASLFGLPVPLLPIQILWVNLVTDGLPALALGVDPVDPKIMDRSPRKSDEPVITGARGWLVIFQGVIIAMCTLAAFLFVLVYEKEGLVRARTAALAVLACTQLFHSFNCRSMKESLFKIGFLTNMSLFYAAVGSFLLQMAIIFVPFLQPIFKTEAMSGKDIGMIVLFSSLPLWIMELVKALNRKFKFYDLY